MTPPVPLSGVGNMKVTNPTITTLTVNWNPADGNVQGYKVIYVPEDGGEEVVVSCSISNVRKKRIARGIHHDAHTVTSFPRGSEGF